MRLTANVQPGNSGGPVLNRRGRVIGIVYAIEIATGYGLAIPPDTLRTLTSAGGFQNVPACGSENRERKAHSGIEIRSISLAPRDARIRSGQRGCEEGDPQ